MKTVLIIIYSIIALAVTVLTLIQSNDDEGASSTITGGSSSSFFEKNKGNTKEGKLRRITIILGALFVVLAIVLGIFY